jgi:hypothetical protein
VWVSEHPGNERAEQHNAREQAKQPALRASDADRERVAAVLHQALGEGRLTVSELEERLDRVYAAKTLEELAPITADLPNAQGVVQLGTPNTAAQQTTGHELIGGTPGSATSVAIFSGTARKGNWVVPPEHNSFALCGGVEIDLRRARFAERETTITAVAIMGGIDIVVPDDIYVEVTGFGVLGAFDSKGDARPDPDPNGPRVTIGGVAIMGGVTVRRKPRKDPPDKHRMI